MEAPKTVQQTVTELIAQYQREAAGPGPIWAGAAQSIVRILQSDKPEEALAKLRKLRKQCRKMSVSCFFGGAANGLALAVRRERRAHRPGGPKTAADMALLIAFGTPLLEDDGKVVEKIATCGNCGRSWNDAMSTGWTPVPSGRCPFEYWHRKPRK
jgi:hypothetical protein